MRVIILPFSDECLETEKTSLVLLIPFKIRSNNSTDN